MEMTSISTLRDGASGTPGRSSAFTTSISGMKFNFDIDKKNRTFEPGDILEGTLSILELPKYMEDVCGIVAVFEAKYHNGSGRSTKIFESKKPIVGSYHNKTELEVGEYVFGMRIPENCPPSFVTAGKKGGQLKYTVRCVGIRLSGRMVTLKQERMICIKPRPLSSLTNQEQQNQPMIDESVIANAGVTVLLKTNQKRYLPGDKIEFSVKVTNLGDKKIHSTKFFLKQQVTLKSTSAIDVNVLTGLVNGPPVNIGCTHVWNGKMEVPGSIPPSVENDSKSSDFGIEFAYSIQCEFRTGRYFGSGSFETDFSVDIGQPVILKTPNPVPTFQPLELSADEEQTNGKNIKVKKLFKTSVLRMLIGASPRAVTPQ